ncbi:hypothetical protein VNO77_15902 [Canavalia gladiata]|uniref:Uncharacterized protein n=1 Tax=Canavalia gladiata TaxID=3824 RepID=A0AAN9M003_CANGL
MNLFPQQDLGNPIMLYSSQHLYEAPSLTSAPSGGLFLLNLPLLSAVDAPGGPSSFTSLFQIRLCKISSVWSLVPPH